MPTKKLLNCVDELLDTIATLTDATNDLSDNAENLKIAVDENEAENALEAQAQLADNLERVVTAVVAVSSANAAVVI